MTTTLATRITIPDGVMFRDLDGEAVLLELDTGRYFGLNGIGTRMWLLLLEHGRVEPAYHTLLGEYEVAEDRLCGELLGFVNCLASRHLLLLHDD